MEIEVSAADLKDIWEALHREPGPHREREALDLWAEIAADGWVDESTLQDALWASDPRISDLRDFAPERLSEALKLPWRGRCSRPAHPDSEPMGAYKLAAHDAALVAIVLERLGFAAVWPEALRPLVAGLDGAHELTYPEVGVLWYPVRRHRLSPVSLIIPWTTYRPWRRIYSRTANGYRLEAWRARDDDALVQLTIRAPLYRTKPKPREIVCGGCGMRFLRGDHDSEEGHTREHRRRLSVLRPRPLVRSARLVANGASSPRVEWNSAHWKHGLLYEQARLFRAELGYDFTQWRPTPLDNAGAEGLLFIDPQGVVDGGCAFRLDSRGESGWLLDWVWVRPDARRSGVLARHWPLIRERYGDFHVSAPVSPAMRGFLKKAGDARLADIGRPKNADSPVEESAHNHGSPGTGP